MISKNSEGRIMVDWKLPGAFILLWAFSIIWFLAGMRADVQANTAFRTTMEPLIQNISTNIAVQTEVFKRLECEVKEIRAKCEVR